MSETVTVVVPAVGFKGPDDTDASTFRRAAWNLEHDYPAGGSNTRMAISILLRRVADELDKVARRAVEAEHSGECGCRSACELNLNIKPADAEFIAASRDAVPALVEIAEEQQLRIEDLSDDARVLRRLTLDQQRRIEELEAERARPFPWLGVAVDPVEQPALDGEVPK